MVQAYQEAKEMVEKRPQSGFAHFTLSYVLRYASLTKGAAEECDAAIRLDPGNYQFRSCSSAFYLSNQFDHARQFLVADAGSEWTNNVGVAMLLREGKTNEALQKLHRMPDSSFFHPRALEACYTTPRPPGSEQLLEEAAKMVSTFQDPEPKYTQAGLFSACLGNDFTARLVKSAIEGGYCAYDYLQVDPMMKEFRKSPQYPAVLAEAKQCQDRFLAERDRQISGFDDVHLAVVSLFSERWHPHRRPNENTS